MKSVYDEDSAIEVSREEEVIALQGAYANGGLVGELKKSLKELHQPFAGMLSSKEEIY